MFYYFVLLLYLKNNKIHNKNHPDVLFRTVARGSWVPPGGAPASPRDSSQKVRESSRKFEEVKKARERLEKVRESY